METTATVLSSSQRQAALRTFSRPSGDTALGLCGFVALVAWSASGTELSLGRLTRGIPLIFEFVVDLWPPDNAYLLQMLEPISVTLQMALLGTLVSSCWHFRSVRLLRGTRCPATLGIKLRG